MLIMAGLFLTGVGAR